MSSIFFLVFFPFIFAFIIAFVLFFVYATPLRIPFVISLFSFCSIFLSSVLQVLLSSLQIKIKDYSTFLLTLFNSYIYSATVEEGIKLLLFYFFLHFFCPDFEKKGGIEGVSPKARDSKISIFLAMFFAACFAAFENISYVATDFRTLPIRMVTVTFLHISIAQYYLYIKANWQKKIFLSLLLPIFIHGSYNLFIALKGKFVILSFAILLFLVVQNIYKIIGKCREG